MPHEQRRGVDAAILALVLAEDWPWRVSELGQRLRIPEDVIGLSTATLRADGLLIPRGESLRASWAAVRSHELLSHAPPNRGPARSNVQRFLPNREAARLLPRRHPSDEDSAPNQQ
jgi:hypothetical protein